MNAERRQQRIRYQVILLVLLAASFYAGFILLGVLKA